MGANDDILYGKVGTVLAVVRTGHNGKNSNLIVQFEKSAADGDSTSDIIAIIAKKDLIKDVEIGAQYRIAITRYHSENVFLDYDGERLKITKSLDRTIIPYEPD